MHSIHLMSAHSLFKKQIRCSDFPPYPCTGSQKEKHLQRDGYFSYKMSSEVSKDHPAPSRTLHSPLLNAKVCIDAGISSCASEIFVFSVWYVLPCPVVPVLFGQTKVNKE